MPEQTKAACFTLNEIGRFEVRQVDLKYIGTIAVSPIIKFTPGRDAASTTDEIKITECILAKAKRQDEIIYFYVQASVWHRLLPSEKNAFINTMSEYIKKYAIDYSEVSFAGGWGLINIVGQ